MEPQIIVQKKTDRIILLLVLSFICLIAITLVIFLGLTVVGSIIFLPRFYLYVLAEILLVYIIIQFSKSLFSKTPGLTATSKGLYFMGFANSTKTIEWKSISAIYSTQLLGQPNIVILMKQEDYDYYLSTTNMIHNLICKANNALLKAPQPAIYIDPRILLANPNELTQHLQLYLEAQNIMQ